MAKIEIAYIISPEDVRSEVITVGAVSTASSPAPSVPGGSVKVRIRAIEGAAHILAGRTPVATAALGLLLDHLDEPVEWYVPAGFKVAGLLAAASGPSYANQFGYPSDATPLHASSGNQANATAVATLTGAADLTACLAGALITCLGATAGGAANLTIAGLLGGTLVIPISVPTGVGVKGDVPLRFDPPLPAAAENADIVLTLAALGAGNVCAGITAWGYSV